MRKFFAVLAGGAAAVSSLVATAPPAAAACSGTFYGTVVDVGGMAYVDVREVASGGYLWSIWLYLESNGQGGLQRGGADPTGSPDTCQESSNPDTLIW